MERRKGPRSKVGIIDQRNEPPDALLVNDSARESVEYVVSCAWVGPGGCWKTWLALGLGLGGLGLRPGGQKPPVWAVRGKLQTGKGAMQYFCGVGDDDAA